MKKAGIAITVIVALLAFACGFGATAGALMYTQPASSSTATVNFQVNQGDTTAIVAQRLQNEGLIRNALLFRLYARLKHLDTGIKPGVYKLTPNMKMAAIVAKLQFSAPDEIIVTIPDALRITQYASHITGLASFNAQNFEKIATSGTWLDGTPVSGTYWFVLPKQKNSAAALEGYLYPDTYDFDAAANETTVIKRLIGTLGEHLCPGPTGNPDAAGEYYLDHTQCRAHAATVGTNVNIFDAMDKAYFTKNDATGDATALYDTLIIASLTTREILRYSDAPGVAGVYWTRFAALYHHITNAGMVANLGSDPSAEYARDTDTPPTNGHWWADLADKGLNVDPKSPYNLDVLTNPNLPPGPIAAASWTVTQAAANPAQSANFYFVSDYCGNIHYAKTGTDFDVIANKYVGTKTCT
ncbi:MAG: endolytic transglycosylase MltG [Ktedonobacterales bacterium]